MEIVICVRHGGFGLTKAVWEELGFSGVMYPDNEKFGIEDEAWEKYRADPRLIAAIKKVGLEASADTCCKLKIVEIPDDVDWYIHEYDGLETIHEKHRIWPEGAE